MKPCNICLLFKIKQSLTIESLCFYKSVELNKSKASPSNQTLLRNKDIQYIAKPSPNITQPIFMNSHRDIVNKDHMDFVKNWISLLIRHICLSLVATFCLQPMLYEKNIKEDKRVQQLLVVKNGHYTMWKQNKEQSYTF